jgi:hypothetical protein
MKINTKSKKRNKKLLLVLAIILAAIVSIILLNYKPNTKSTDESNTPTITTEQKTQDTTTVTKNDTSTDSTNNSSSILNITTTALGQDQKQGPILIRTIVDNVTGGSCTYTLSKGATIKNYSSEVSFSGTYYSCNYTVPYSDLSAGTWNIKISVSQNNKSGTVSKDIIVE